MPTERKAQEIELIADMLRNASLAILTDYRGLSVSDMQALRAQLRPQNATFRVVKNTLTSIAADSARLDGVKPLLTGPTALVVTTSDPVQVAKVVNEFARTSRILQVKGAVLEGEVIPAAAVEDLATLPPREVLLARVVGGVQAPIAGLVGVLSGTIRALGYVLNARAEQLGGAQS